MTFSEVLKYFRVGDTVPYRNAHGRLTRRGSFVVSKIKDETMTIRIPNRKSRQLRESDWDEVLQNLDGLQSSRSIAQSMQTQNATYILSLRWSPEISGRCT